MNGQRMLEEPITLTNNIKGKITESFLMREDFSWDRSAKKYIEVYRSIIKG